MGTCTKSSLLEEVETLAAAHAQANGIANLYSVEETARSVIEQAFGSLAWETGTNWLHCWRHRDEADHDRDWRSLLISRDSLIGAAERYVEIPWLQSRNVDWFFVDCLVYAEFQAYLDVVRTQRYGIFRSAADKGGDRTVLRWLFAGRALLFLISWASWFAIVMLALAIHPIAAFCVFAITAVLKAMKYYDRMRQRRLLEAMLKAYVCLRSPSLSWRVVWDELNEARKHGVVFDGVVFRLVESRMTPAVATSLPLTT
jgi:hypothetical protein